MGLKAFRRIQISNPEDTVGTAEAAVEILYGTMSFKPGLIIHQPDEDRNNLAANVADDLVVGKLVELNWQGDLNFRHIIWALAMSLCGNITPTQPDPTNEPNAYLWTFTPALTAPNTPDESDGIDTFTIEYGDDTQAYEAEYCFATQIQISGAPNEPVKISLTINGRQETDTTFTAALTAQTVQRAPFNKAKFYIDTTWAGLGGTQKTGLLRGFTWTLDTMFKAFVTADGNLYFASVVEDKKNPVLELTYRWNSDSDSEKTKYENRTDAFLRIEIWGESELDSGQDNLPYLILDQCVRYTDWPELSDEEGASTVKVTAEGRYDATGAKMFEAKVLTDLDAYPT
jgi:hypothetical protein